MQTYEDPHALREQVAYWRRDGQRIALVPTMGYLHEGHLQLVRDARARADRVVVSIFVNPTQFAPGEDYASYPRTLEADSQRLVQEGVDALFAPDVQGLYPRGPEAATRVVVPGLSEILCGAHRDGHFVGVATVVCKLFNLVAPDCAVFGRKDFQQLQVIRRMVEDLDLPVEVVGCATVRETDGLAKSSRNAYLSDEQRRRAPALYRTLRLVARALCDGSRDFRALEADALDRLRGAGLEPDYFSIRHHRDLAPPRPELPAADLVVLAAAHLGEARLIDNIEVVDIFSGH